MSHFADWSFPVTDSIPVLNPDFAHSSIFGFQMALTEIPRLVLQSFLRYLCEGRTLRL